jgi:oxalate decarboxylase/phosphoglucose isomerase-like protein (cupin superfamily)
MKTKWERENFLSTERKFSQAPHKSNVHSTLSPMRNTWERENFLSAERKFPKAPHKYSIQSHPLTNEKHMGEGQLPLGREEVPQGSP